MDGQHPLDGTPLEVIDGLPETAAPEPADPPEEPAVSSPGLHPDEIAEVVQKLMAKM